MPGEDLLRGGRGVRDPVLDLRADALQRPTEDDRDDDERGREEQDDEQQRRAQREQDDHRADAARSVDDSRLVTVCVSIVRTSVTSLERRDTSSPTRCWPVEVEREGHEPPIQVAAELGHDPLPHDPEQPRLDEPATAWTQNSTTSSSDESVEPARVAARDDLAGDARDDEREGEPDERPDQQADDGDRERRRAAAEGSAIAAPTARRRSRAPGGRPRRRRSGRERTAGS